ncbi:MAG: hypothetical protein IPK97_09165 [Ahniella sp.]|nr:hypothetical protein [Ahniella sp.]
MFLPFDYRRDWTIGENRSWNEQYLLQALLQFSSGYRILFGCNYAFYRFRNEIINVINHPNGHGFGGGSFYFQKT